MFSTCRSCGKQYRKGCRVCPYCCSKHGARPIKERVYGDIHLNPKKFAVRINPPYAKYTLIFVDFNPEYPRLGIFYNGESINDLHKAMIGREGDIFECDPRRARLFLFKHGKFVDRVNPIYG